MWHVWGDRGNGYRILVPESEGKIPLRISTYNERIILKSISKEWD
jgi:hypothetical protein